MVAHRSFLIDATFLLDEAERAFLGSAPIVNSRGQNTSVIYGAVRAMLRLRGTLGIVYGIAVVGAEAKAVSSATNIEMFCDCLRAIGTCTLHEVGSPVGALCQSMLHEREVRWIVTRNKSLMQLAGASCRVILTSEGGTQPDVITQNVLASRFGIRPDQVPSPLALTDTSSGDLLSTKQAVRLLEVCGSLDAAFESSSAEAASTKTRRYLNANKAALLTQLRDLTVIPHVAKRLRRLPMSPLVRNNAASRSALREQGFPSLGRLLATPESVELVTTARDREEAYVAIVDPAGLRSLKAVLANADVCVVDTEATDKDPRRARLLGVALAVREGQAFYVPVTAPGLRDVSPASVIDILRELLARRVGIVGHNLKYDYVLLRRHGIQIGDTHFDTMLAAHECFGDWEFFNLGAVSKRLLGREVKRYRDMVGQRETPQDVPFRELVEHGCADADATLRLYGRLRVLLKEKSISDQFAREVMPLMRLLGDRECGGVRVDLRSLRGKRDALAREADVRKTAIVAMTGKHFDLESLKEITVVFRGIDGIREQIPRQTLRQGQLEQLAQVNAVARAIVEYGRVQKRIGALDAICKDERNGRVYPVFSQVKPAHGSVTAVDPRLFDPLGTVDAGAVLDAEIRQLMPDEDRALDLLQTLTRDRSLASDRRGRKSAFIGGGKPSIAGLSHSGVLIALAIGVSNAALCKRFLIDPRRASVLREEVTARYPTLFGWLDEYRKSVMSAGFASSGTRRRYWEGLRSSDLDRRNRAVRSAVRWLIGM